VGSPIDDMFDHVSAVLGDLRDAVIALEARQIPPKTEEMDAMRRQLLTAQAAKALAEQAMTAAHQREALREGGINTNPGTETAADRELRELAEGAGAE